MSTRETTRTPSSSSGLSAYAATRQIEYDRAARPGPVTTLMSDPEDLTALSGSCAKAIKAWVPYRNEPRSSKTRDMRETEIMTLHHGSCLARVKCGRSLSVCAGVCRGSKHVSRLYAYS